ncbi:hypothetical protein [Paenibacillus silviterrae]|uniref:hypothetical protein n=1 Tax=Paenibacillus silviterrae TaxID=3242194 RepID=UPI002542D0DC|nr:hypothetical protein [Paenibacillus chinjuensis]
MFEYSKDYFMQAKPYILENMNLRAPQIEAYQAVFDILLLLKAVSMLRLFYQLEQERRVNGNNPLQPLK